MTIHFETSRWDALADNFTQWWCGDLKRPIIQVTLHGAFDPGREKPQLGSKSFTSHFDDDVSPESIVDLWDYEHSKCEYLGDAFPDSWANFGPGVMAAFTGCELINNEHTTWFHPSEVREAKDISIRFDQDNKYFKRICDIYKAALERWQGGVQLSMTDIGGSLDVVSSFRPSESLLFDLYDDPENIKRLNWEVHEAWFKYFEAFNAILQPVNPGYTAWTPIFSKEPYYMLQCDFCYMIGPEMFDEFVKPELEESCRKLANPFYHLDGPGQLAHLDSLLKIDDLKGVQWVPGDGAARPRDWPAIYRKIRDAGKLIQVLGDFDDFAGVVEHLGSAEGLYYKAHRNVKDRASVEAFLSRYGVA